MKFSSKEDIAAPIGDVFRIITDFDSYERAALRRGIEVMRTDSLAVPGPGMGWKSRVPYRGKTRELTTTLGRYDVPEHMTLTWIVMGLNGMMDIELMQLSPRHTRLAVALEMKPNTLTARLFIQSLRLAKSSLNRKFKAGVGNFARDIESRLGVDQPSR